MYVQLLGNAETCPTRYLPVSFSAGGLIYLGLRADTISESTFFFTSSFNVSGICGFGAEGGLYCHVFFDLAIMVSYD